MKIKTAFGISILFTLLLIICFVGGWYTNEFFRTFLLNLNYIDNSMCLSHDFSTTMNNPPGAENTSIFILGIDLLSTNNVVDVMTRGDDNFPEVTMSRKNLVLYNIITSPTFVQMGFVDIKGPYCGGYRLYQRQSNVWFFTKYEYRTDKLSDRIYDVSENTVKNNKGVLTNEIVLYCIKMHPTNFYNKYYGSYRAKDGTQ